MRLVVLTNILTPYRLPLFEALQRRVDDFTVLLMARNEENRQWRVDSPRFKTILLPGIHFRPRGYPVSLHCNYGVMRILRQVNPDAVISGGFGSANMAAFLYCKLNRKKYVGWAHLTLQDSPDWKLMRRGLRHLMVRWSDGSIGESSDARDAFVYYGAKPDRVLSCVMPLDVRRIRDQTASVRSSSRFDDLRANYPGPIMLSIGQAIPRKGYAELFQIYERLVAVRPDISLLVIGNGPERARYERRVLERGWRQVHFIGFVQPDELHHYLALGDVFVFHTLYDPFGLVLSEAMAAELPVISSIYASATRDLIEDGVNGFRINPKDIASSAAVILKVLEMTTEERQAMGRAAYERVKQTDIGTSADAIVRFLEFLSDSEGFAGKGLFHEDG
jgi:glycosyltransferase involved in cell wall biosynthesis